MFSIKYQKLLFFVNDFVRISFVETILNLLYLFK